MTIPELVLAVYGFVGSTASVISIIDTSVLKSNNCSSEELFERCFTRAVMRNAMQLAQFTSNFDYNEITVEPGKLNDAVSSLREIDLSALAGEKYEIFDSIRPHFRNCILIEGNPLDETLQNHYLPNILKNAIADFYSKLPLTDQAFKELLLDYIEKDVDERQSGADFRNSIFEMVERMLAVQKDISEKLSYLDPTIMLKESGRAQYKNPFRIVKAEEFDHNYPLLASLFRKPSNYDLIRGRDNLIISGGRGCGKSMILRSLSAPIAMTIEAKNRGGERLYFRDSGLDYFGVYIKLAKGYFDDWRPDSALTPDAAIQLFQHAFNMQLLKASIDTLIECRGRVFLNIPPAIERSISAEISSLIVDHNLAQSFSELKKLAIVQERAIGHYLGTLRLGNDAKYTGNFTYINDFPKEFCRIILDNIEDLNASRIYFLLDEFENLTEFQQSVVNTITKLRPESLTIKLSTRALGVKSRIDLQGEPIQSPRDYQMVSLDYDVNSTEYADLLCEISKKRLSSEGCSQEDIKTLLPNLGPYPELGLEKIKKILAKYLKEHRDIDFTELSPKQQEEWVHRMGVAITFRERASSKYPKMYCGFKVFVDCSSGIISNFLELCKMAFYLAESSNQDVRGGEPISPDIQNEAIYLVSKASIEWLPRNIPQTGYKIGRLLHDFGEIFREKLLKHETEPEAARIVIKDPERLDAEDFAGVVAVFDDAVKWSVLHALGASAYLPKHKTDVRPNEFTLNRMLIPTLRISGRPRWRTEFTTQDIYGLLSSKERARKKSELIRKHSGKKPGNSARGDEKTLLNFMNDEATSGNDRKGEENAT